jgi:hypothetical protein
MSDLILNAALSLAERGATPIPLRGKVPVLDGWQKLRNVTPDMIRKWNTDGLLQNVGIVCGEASKNLVVIDFDGLDAYKAFTEKFPDLAETFTVLTGSGKGKHAYFKVDLLPPSEKAMNTEYGNIEIKANGTQVVTPPSVHPETNLPYSIAKQLPIKQVSDLSGLLAWIRELKPVGWTPPTTQYAPSDEINTQVKQALTRYFEQQPGAKYHGEWINCPCPQPANHKNGDRTPSFGYNTASGVGHCYACGAMLTKNLCEYAGIDYKALGGLFEKSIPPGASPNVDHSTGEVKPPTPAQPSANGTQFIDRADVLSTYINRVFDLDKPPDASPILFPLHVLHEFGGMAKVIKPGKLVAVVGTSGSGKTSLLETMVDGWLRIGINVMVWSPEWDADEFADRSVQRYGGPSATDIYMHEMYKAELADGKTSGFLGKQLTKEQEASAMKAIRTMREWSGNVTYIQNPLLTSEQLHNELTTRLAPLSRTERPKGLVLDYAQLMHSLQKLGQGMSMYEMLMRIKASCVQHKLVGVVATQTTKADARGANGGALLDNQSARYVNDDPFNLFITLNPEVTEFNIPMDTAVLNLVKNSQGRKGKVRIASDLEHLVFIDKKHANQNFSDQGEEL